jgi:RNA polymerase sigma factor (sigma-70 family)
MHESPAPFQATRWSLVLQAAQSPDSVKSQAALGELYRAYYYPLYVFARDRGRRSAEDAGDLVQDFFVRVLEKNMLGSADPARGKFRSFLLGAFKNLIVTQWRDANRQKRGGGAGHISLDIESAESRYAAEGIADTAASPDETYDIQWARTLVQSVLARLKAENSAAEFAALSPSVTGARGEVPLTETAAALGLSESAAKSRIHRFRQRWAALVREEVARTVDDPAEVDAELRHLLACLRA